MVLELVNGSLREILATHADSSFRLELEKSRDQINCIGIKCFGEGKIHFLDLLIYEILIIGFEGGFAANQLINYTP